MIKSIKIKLYVLLVLSSLTFYNPFGIISAQMGKFIFYLICIISLLYAYKYGINLHTVKYPKTSYKMLIAGILLSILMSTAFQDQSLYITTVVTLSFLFGYAVFYILMKFNIPKETIEKTIWIFCFIGMSIYIINMITFPNMIFGVEKDEYDMSRGIIRIGIPSLELIVLFFLYSINQWVITKKRKYILLTLITIAFIILSVTRQYIIISIALGLILILQKTSITKRLITIGLCVIIYFFILPKVPIYKTMVDLSTSQIEKNRYQEDDIRIRAWRFYTYEYQTNGITPILGNGVPSIGNSLWGNKFEETTNIADGGNGCYAVDVGWAGFFWNFGLIATIGLLSLFIHAILKRKSLDHKYLNYWIVFICLTSIASGPILYYNQIISISIVLYLIYGREKKYIKQDNCINHPQLQ